MAGIKIVDLPALGRDLLSTDLFEMSIGGTASRKITGQEIMNASKLNVGSTPIVSGTVGRVLFQGTGNVLQQSGNLFWDETNGRLGIGGSPAVYNLDVKGIGIYRGGLLDLQNTTGSVTLSFYPSAGNLGIINSDILRFGRISNGTVFLQGFASGNIGINTTTDAGFRLDVNGTARVKTDLKIETATGGLTIEGDAAGYPTLKINTLRSGTTRRNWMFATEQITTGDFVLFRSATGGGAANTLVYSIFNDGNFGLNTSTNDGFKLDVNGTARVSGNTTVALNQNAITSLTVQNNTVGTSAQANITVTANSNSAQFTKLSTGLTPYKTLAAGDLGIYNTTSDISLLTEGSGKIKFAAGGVSTAQMTLFATGNLGINTTTDAGFRLDVNGTARVNNIFYVTNPSFTGNIRIESIGNNQQRITGAFGENITWGATGNTININAGETYISNSLLGQGFWIQSNGATVIGAQSAAAASSILDLRSTTRGFLPPRMTNAQRTAIVSPAVGLIVYCTDVTEGLWVFKSAGWTFIV